MGCELRGKFITIQYYLKKRKISNNLNLHIKQLEKEGKTKPKFSGRKEIIRIRAEIKRQKNNCKDQ